MEGVFEEAIEPAVFLFASDSCQIGSFPDPFGFGVYETPSMMDEIIERGLIAYGGPPHRLDLLEAQQVFIWSRSMWLRSVGWMD